MELTVTPSFNFDITICILIHFFKRLFKVNGQPIFIRGGNWILSDGLLRLSKKRYKTDIKFHADMNLNMIRCWGGGLAERPEFYHYCDVYGLLVSYSSLSLSSPLSVCMACLPFGHIYADCMVKFGQLPECQGFWIYQICEL